MFQSVYNLLGETLTRLHQFDEAERWYQAALQAQPDHVPAHITYGKLLAKNVSTSNLITIFKVLNYCCFFFQSSRVVEAEQWFRRAQRLAPGDPSVYHHYGKFKQIFLRNELHEIKRSDQVRFELKF